MCICVALLGNEERNKNFLDNLAEDEHGNAIGIKDIQDIKQEQGEKEVVETTGSEQQQEQHHVEKN